MYSNNIEYILIIIDTTDTTFNAIKKKWILLVRAI